VKVFPEYANEIRKLRTEKDTYKIYMTIDLKFAIYIQLYLTMYVRGLLDLEV